MFTFGQEAPTARLYNYSFFGRDVWKATSRLALTYGLRWEINTPLGSISPGKPLYNVNSIFNSLPFGLAPVSTLGHTHFNNFAPRVGASYLMTPETIVRGGFGLFSSMTSVSEPEYREASPDFHIIIVAALELGRCRLT